jgi:hypothetical protein
MSQRDPTTTSRSTANSRRAAEAAEAAEAAAVAAALLDTSGQTPATLNPSDSSNTIPFPSMSIPLGLSAEQWASVQTLISTAVSAAIQTSGTPRPRRADINPPDTFDGSDPTALPAFLSQCLLVFKARPDEYTEDTAKINYAVLYLRGSAQQWYLPFLSESFETPITNSGNSDDPDADADADSAPAPNPVTTSWKSFTKELSIAYGEAQPKIAAQGRMLQLSMTNKHHVSRYASDFANLAPKTGFNDPALFSQYYRGLAPRLKEIIDKANDPLESYQALVAYSRRLDQNYWARISADASFVRSSFVSSPSVASTSNSGSSPASRASSVAPNSDSNSASRVKRSGSPLVDLSGKLGPDGKLTPAEKQRRKTLGLCLFCGSSDHRRSGCPLAPPRLQDTQVFSGAAPGSSFDESTA